MLDRRDDGVGLSIEYKSIFSCVLSCCFVTIYCSVQVSSKGSV